MTTNSEEMKNRDFKYDLDVMKMTDGQYQTEVKLYNTFCIQVDHNKI